MSIELQMIGTGSAFAKRFFNNNALITVNGYRLLVDCGITAPYALHQLKVNLPDIDGIFITHIHADHIGGLEEIAFRTKFIHQCKLELYIPSSLEKPLWETSLKGGMEDKTLDSDSLDNYFHVHRLLPGTPIEISEGFVIELVPTIHIPGKPSYGLFINNNVFYSSDTTFNPELLTELVNSRRCKHILHDCQLTGKGVVHTELNELLTLPESIQEKIWLMHYEDERDRFLGKTGKMRFIEQHRLYEFE